MNARAKFQAKSAVSDTAERGGSRPFFSAPVQTRLMVGRRGDRFEREADSAADAVVHGTGPLAGSTAIAPALTPTGGGLGTQRTPMEEEAKEPIARMPMEEAQTQEDEEAQAQKEEEAQAQEEEEAQAQEEEETQAQEEEEAQTQEVEEAQAQEEEEAQTQEEELQARGSGRSHDPDKMDRVSRGIRTARGLGNPLPEDARRRMETQFGAELSGVRIHTDALAVQLTEALHAQAFASGKDIFFNKDKFAPGTNKGDHLLAHEIAHSFQQGGIKANIVQLAEDPDTIHVRPEALKAIGLARAEIGGVNTKLNDAEGNRIGWQRVLEFFRTAFGGDTIHPDVIRKITMIEMKGQKKDALPHWCGIFTWWALKTAGVPLPDWKIGMNILDAVDPVPHGTLPQKGMIAYANKNQHFALVSAVESTADAEGKPMSQVMIRTINGNTAGADNLGGQVQEVWDPYSRWNHFFDPFGKANLPDVPLVATTRDSEDVVDVSEPGDVDEITPEAEDATAQTVIPEGEIPPTAELDAGSEAEVALDIPPPAALPPPEPVAKVEKVGLQGSSNQAMDAFTAASPSSVAATAPDLSGALEGKVAGEQAEATAQAPELKVQTGGDIDPGITPPDQIATPGDGQVGDGVTGATPADLVAKPHKDKAPPPTNKETEKLMDKQPEGGFLAWLRSAITGLMRNIRTKDSGVSTNAGPRENVEMKGEADPERMDRQKEEGADQLRSQRDTQTTAFKTHPGQSNIKPRQIDEARKPTLSKEPAATPEAIPPSTEAQDYLDAALPKEVRAKADEDVAPQLQPGLDSARTKAADAASTRDSESVREKKAATEKARKINEDADRDQKQIVLDNRQDVARQQGDGVAGAYERVQEFSDDAAKEQTAKNKDIGDHVKAEEGKAHKKLEDGEKEAEDKKTAKEKEAADKKKELERDQKKGSWWDRAANLVKKAVSFVTEAIDKIFTALREAVATIIEKAKEAAVGLINAARDWAIDKLNGFRDWAKSKVDKYLKDSFPGLASAINSGIDATVDVAIKGVNVVADTAIAGVEALADGLAAVLDKILSVYQTALKAAVGIAGAVLTGDFAGALKIAVQSACDIAGIDSKPIFDFFDRAGESVTKILKNVPTFFNNLITAVGMGIRNFGDNILTHLKTGLIEWLTGAISEAGITLPQKWDVMGIFSLVAQILGLTYANIKARIIKKYPAAEKVFDMVEKAFALVMKIKDLDFSGLWEEVKSQLSNLYEMVIGGIRNWVMTTVIKEGIVWLLSLMNPASAIVKVLKVLFDLVMWLIERFDQIKTFVLSVYDSITKIASGVLGPAAKSVEDALVRSLPVVISMIASVIGLGGVGKAVKELLEKITTPINKVIDAVIDKVVDFAKGLLGKAKAGAKKVKEKIADFLWPKKMFSVEGESHTLEFSKSGAPMIRSTPQALSSFIAAWEKNAGKPLSAAKEAHLKTAKAKLKEMKTVSAEVDKLENAKKKVPQAKLKKLLALQTEISVALKGMLGTASDLAKGKERYKLEGLTGTFGTIPKPKGDHLTGDHQPQAAVIKHLASRPYFQDPHGAEIRNRAAGSHAQNAYVINLQTKRHMAGRTYGSKGKSTKAAFISALSGVEEKVPASASKTKKEQAYAKNRKAAVRLLKSELSLDVSVMRGVYGKASTDPIWDDLDKFTSGSKKARSTLVKDIKAQVGRGQSIIAGQPMTVLEK